VASDRVTGVVQVDYRVLGGADSFTAVVFLRFASLPVLPAVVPVARFGIPASPTSGRTAGDAVSRSELQVFISASREASCSRCERFLLVVGELFPMREDLFTQCQDQRLQRFGIQLLRSRGVVASIAANIQHFFTA